MKLNEEETLFNLPRKTGITNSRTNAIITMMRVKAEELLRTTKNRKLRKVVIAYAIKVYVTRRTKCAYKSSDFNPVEFGD